MSTDIETAAERSALAAARWVRDHSRRMWEEREAREVDDAVKTCERIMAEVRERYQFFCAHQCPVNRDHVRDGRDLFGMDYETYTYDAVVAYVFKKKRMPVLDRVVSAYRTAKKTGRPVFVA